MKILVACSWVTGVCALLTALWTVPQGVLYGTVGVSTNPLFHVLFLFPGQIGVPVCLLAAFYSVVLAVKREFAAVAERIMAAGQLFSVLLLAACAYVLVAPAAMGREFVIMALAFQVGQVLVICGLALRLRRLHREGGLPRAGRLRRPGSGGR